MICDRDSSKEAARALFQRYSGRNGSIDNSEVSSMLVDLYRGINKGFNPSQGDIESYFRALDQDNDGRVTLEDIERLAFRYLGDYTVVKQEPVIVRKEVIKKAGVTRTYTNEAKRRLEVAERLFDRFDKDKSKSIDKEEVPNILKETYEVMGMKEYQPSREDCEIWLQMTDTNNDGKVSLQEYTDLVIKSLKNAGIQIYED